MKKILSLFIILSALAVTSNAQKLKGTSRDSSKTTAPATQKDWSKVDLNKRPADHFIFQYGLDGWAGAPDSIRTKGFCRHFNFYVMLDKPFKTDPHYNVAYGLGIGSSNIFFDNEIVNLAGTGGTLPFTDVSNSDHFRKFKLTTIYAELPAEIRYYAHPEDKTTGWKAALGVKLGVLLKGYTKGKDYESSSNSSYYGTSYIQKVSDKRFLNGSKVAISGRIGYGFFSLHGDFNVLGVMKSGAGPIVNAYSIGISIGGL